MEERVERGREGSDDGRRVSVAKAFSDRPGRKDERVVWRNRGTDSTVPEVITYLLMKEKFQQIYKRIEKMSQPDERLIQRIDRGFPNSQSPESSIKVIHLLDRETHPEICKVKTSQLYPKRSLQEGNEVLQISTVNETEDTRGKSNSSTPMSQVQPVQHHLRKSRYRKKMLEPMTKMKMSNNIKDYLSVERIAIKEMEQPILVQKSKLLKQYHLSNLLGLGLKGMENSQELKASPSAELPSEVPSKVENILVRRASKFKAPFELYHYRDFMWQVGFSNGVVVEPVVEYEGKVKFYVGPGNNSNLIKGVMRRRPWFALTDKVAEANLVWTQIKVPGYFTTQTKGQRLPPIAEEEKSLLASVENKLKKSNPLLNGLEQQRWDQYWKANIDRERKIKQNLKGRSKAFGLSQTSLSKIRNEVKIHNHLVNNFIIGNKKALFKTMSEFYASVNKDVFQYLPLTFHIKNNLEDDQYLKFLQHYYSLAKASKNDPNCIHKYNAWIVKPGENTNRGNGIIVCLQLNEIKAILKKQQKHSDGTLKTYILQKYIERPLLYKKRKFDLRHYIMLNCAHGRMKGYWYKEGYVRTTSTEYTLKISNGSIHLTNDAVQKNLPDYGKFQKGNKIYYEELDQYIKKQDPNFDFMKLIYPKMKQRATDVIHASALNIDPERRVSNFQIFGLDFMIDANYDVWLIEVNTNPCLETTCPVLNKIIPRFIQNTLQICIDPVFPAPLGFVPKYANYLQNLAEENNFELVFDQRIDGAKSIGESVLASGAEEEEDIFDDDGQDFDEGN